MLVLLLCCINAFAGCGESDNYFYHLRNGKVVSQGKGSIEECSNSMDGGFERWYYKKIYADQTYVMEGQPEPKNPLTVNDKPASFAKKKVKGVKMDCLIFGKNKQEMICMKPRYGS